jgi:peptidoglycan-associated lipoprotein
MQKQRIFPLLIGTVVAMGLMGCAAIPSKTHRGQDQDHYSASVRGLAEQRQFAAIDQWGNPDAEQVAPSTYLFDFDRYAVKAADQEAIEAHAAYLLANPQQRIRIEGHTSEEGTREYNIALGEKRAKAVANVLLAQGVNPNQINIVSYGKEKPLLSGHTQAAYQQNRRASVVYEGA